MTDFSDLVDRACPLCGAPPPPFPLYRSPIPALSVSHDERALYWRGFRSRTCFFDYYKCETCEMVYCPVYFSHDALKKLYASMPDNTAGASEDVLSETHHRYISFLNDHVPMKGTYLELGPDIGIATTAAIELGDLEQLLLVEPNRSVHDRLRASAGELRIELVESLSDLDPEAKAGSAALVHVLDHLTEPRISLNEIRDHLSPGAGILVVVHNHSSLLRKVLGRRWPPFSLQHPQLFSKDTLRRMLELEGFMVTAEADTRNSFPLRYLARTGSNLVGMSIPGIDHLPDWSVRLRLGNIMAVGVAA